MDALPQITVLPGKHKRAKAGHPWIYANEIAMTAEAKALPPGSLVSVVNSGGEAMGTAFFSAHTLVVARLLSRRAAEPLTADFVAARLQNAMAWREKLFAEPYYRLVHAEADGLPGLIVDRFGNGLVCQFNSAGLERHRDAVLAGIEAALQPEWLIGVGAFAQGRAKEALKGMDVQIGRVLHPSPASPAANRGWAEQATKQMIEQRLWS